jgi:outer membrane protein assembly factor BamB
VSKVAAATIACAGALAACGSSAPPMSSPPHGEAAAASTHVADGDWTTFDYDASRTGADPATTGITAANARGLGRRVIRIDGVADSAPIQVHAIRVRGRVRDVVVVTTTFGHTIAFDPHRGAKLWEFLPSPSAQITTAAPVLDPNRRFVYAASPDGMIHKLSVVSGRQVWAARITFDPRREKIAGALNISGRYVVAVTGGYFGDAPTYQGHLALIDRSSGRIAHVWNSLCSDRHHLLDPPSSCPFSDSAIWGRAGAVVEPGTGRLLIATGNGPFNGRTNWGNSALELSPDASALLHSWTPSNQKQLAGSDTDVGSTAPALLGGGLSVQGGKDGLLSLLRLDRLAVGHTGGELQRVSSPGGGEVLTAPAVWRHAGRTWLFVADDGGTAAYVLSGGRLHVAWQDGVGGTSPVLAGGLLYIYDQSAGTLRILRPLSGATVATLPAANGHWSSPIVVGGRVILAVGGSTSDNATSGTVFVYHLAGR